MNRAVSKTVVWVTPAPRVRIPPPPLRAAIPPVERGCGFSRSGPLGVAVGQRRPARSGRSGRLFPPAFPRGANPGRRHTRRPKLDFGSSIDVLAVRAGRYGRFQMTERPVIHVLPPGAAVHVLADGTGTSSVPLRLYWTQIARFQARQARLVRETDETIDVVSRALADKEEISVGRPEHEQPEWWERSHRSSQSRRRRTPSTASTGPSSPWSSRRRPRPSDLVRSWKL